MGMSHEDSALEMVDLRYRFTNFLKTNIKDGHVYNNKEL